MYFLPQTKGAGLAQPPGRPAAAPASSIGIAAGQSPRWASARQKPYSVIPSRTGEVARQPASTVRSEWTLDHMTDQVCYLHMHRLDPARCTSIAPVEIDQPILVYTAPLPAIPDAMAPDAIARQTVPNAVEYAGRKEADSLATESHNSDGSLDASLTVSTMMQMWRDGLHDPENSDEQL